MAHTDQSSAVVDCGTCHTLFASGRTDLIVSGWMDKCREHELYNYQCYQNFLNNYIVSFLKFL